MPKTIAIENQTTGNLEALIMAASNRDALVAFSQGRGYITQGQHGRSYVLVIEDTTYIASAA